MKRFKQVMLASAASLMLVTAGCSSPANTVPVSLANAQAEANAMVTAFEDIAALTTLTPAQQTALAAAKQAVATFDAIQPGSTYVAAGEAVVNQLTPLIAALGVPTGTSIAITAGIQLVEGLVNGLTAVPALTTTSAVAAGGTLTTTIEAPISIPVPVALK